MLKLAVAIAKSSIAPGHQIHARHLIIVLTHAMPAAPNVWCETAFLAPPRDRKSMAMHSGYSHSILCCTQSHIQLSTAALPPPLGLWAFTGPLAKDSSSLQSFSCPCCKHSDRRRALLLPAPHKSIATHHWRVYETQIQNK